MTIRRAMNFGSEDIGLAQPTALVVANAVFRAVETIGLRELNQNPSRAVARVRAGVTVVVTDRGRPILRMVPGASIEVFDPPLRDVTTGDTGDLVLTSVGASATGAFTLDIQVQIHS